MTCGLTAYFWKVFRFNWEKVMQNAAFASLETVMLP
jgi:hypothetical protein